MKRRRDSRRASHAAARRRRKGSGLISASDRNVVRNRQKPKSVPTPFRRRSKGAAATRALSVRAITQLATETVTLPPAYGETSLVVFPIQPYAVHACWEVTPEALGQARSNLGVEADAAEPVLRFHRAVDPPEPAVFDVRVDIAAGDWYVDLWRAGQTYLVELGLRTLSGRFQPLARSNRVETPRAEPVPVGAVSGEDRRRERGPAGEVAGVPPPAEQSAQGGQASGARRRATRRPVGRARPAGGDVTGQSEAAFQAGISSRR